MAAPVFVAEHEGANWNTTTTPKAPGAFTPASGSVLVALSANENTDGTAQQTTISGGPTWTLRQDALGTSGADCYGCGYTAIGAGLSITPSLVMNGRSTAHWGFNILEFSGSGGVGASAKNPTTGLTGTHVTLALTTTQANSAVAFIVVDFNAVTGTPTYDSINGSGPTEQTRYQGGTDYSVYAGWYPDVGVIGSKTLGVTLGASMDAMFVAVEILGTAGGASAPTPGPFNFTSAAVQRAASW